MQENSIRALINNELLNDLFPPEKADMFFEALYGGAEAGAFDISLHYLGFNSSRNILQLEFRLKERPGKCMACNLTHGLPEVFMRHPVIDLPGIAGQIKQTLPAEWDVKEWSLGNTLSLNSKENSIPLQIHLTTQ